MAAEAPLNMFPCEIWERIFSLLKTADTSTLLAGRETCRDFKYWVDTKTSLWSRNPKDYHGRTPLHWAAKGGHTKIVEMLMSRGARVHTTNMGDDTPLHLAAAFGNRDIVLMVRCV